MMRESRASKVGRHPFKNVVITVIFLLLFSNSLFVVPPTSVAHAATTTTAPNPTPSHPAQSMRSNPKAEADWFQLSHFGKHLPSPDARIQAFKQAQRVKRVPISAHKASPTHATSLSPQTAGTVGVLSPLGPQPVTNACYGCDQGVFSGRITALAVNPTNSSDVWAGAADGGVWHSTDAGAHWASVTDGQYTLSIGSIAIDPTNPSTIYVGTGESDGANVDGYWGIGILKSIDGGQTWKKYGLEHFGGLSIGKIAIDPTNNSTLLVSVCCDNHGGAGPKDGPGTPLPGDPTRTTALNRGIWRSTDSGQTWTPTNLQNVEATDVITGSISSNFMYAGTEQGVYQSADHGSTWVLTPGLPTPSSTVSIGRVRLQASADGTHIYAVMVNETIKSMSYGDLLNNAIYASSNNGVSWTSHAVPTYMACDQGDGSLGPDCGHQWWYEAAIGVDPLDSNIVWVGGRDLYYSTDGGVNWTDATLTYTTNPYLFHPDQHIIAYFNDGSHNFYVGNDGGVWSSNGLRPPDLRFQNLNAGGLNITQFYAGGIGTAGSYARLYGGAQDNGTSQYPLGSSGLAQWNIMLPGDGGDVAVDWNNNVNVYAEGADGAFNKSVDGGGHWSSAQGWTACTPSITKNCDTTNFIMPFVMSQNNSSVLYAGTDRVYMTTNGAGRWTSLSRGPLESGWPISALAVARSNENYIYVGLTDGYVALTTDGGKTWSAPAPVLDSTDGTQSTGGMVTGLAVDPIDQLTAYVTFAKFANCSSPTTTDSCGEHVFKTSDAGSHWKDISKGLPDIPFESVVVHPLDHNTVIVGSDVGIFESTDAGANWMQLYGLPNVAVDQIFTDHNGTNLYVATHGRGMWTAPLVTGNVYFQSTYAYLYSTDAATGSLRWRTPTSSQDPPILGNGIVYTHVLNSSTSQYDTWALDSSSGSLLWTISNFAASVLSGGVLYGSTLVGPSSNLDSGVAAYNAGTGAFLWSYDSGVYNNWASFWPGVISNGTLFVASSAHCGTCGSDMGGGYIYALNASTGAFLWRTHLYMNGTPFGLVTDGSQVYTTMYDNGTVYAVNASTGSLAWGAAVGATSVPAIDNGTIYVSGHGTYNACGTCLLALNASTGGSLWQYAMGGSGLTPAVANGMVYVGSSDFHVYAVNASNGSFIWSFATGNTVGNPTAANGMVYVGSNDSYLYALNGDIGTLIWKYQAVSGGYYTPVVGA